MISINRNRKQQLASGLKELAKCNLGNTFASTKVPFMLKTGEAKPRQHSVMNNV